MDEDDQSSSRALYVGSHGELAPQTCSDSSVFHSCEDTKKPPACQRRRRPLVGERRGCGSGTSVSKRRRMNTSSIKQSDPRNIDEEKVIQDQQDDKIERMDFEKEFPKHPSTGKKWLIGPLFQSFKSKMASFTEIVMSPVRIFQSSDSPPSNASPSHSEQLSGSNLERPSSAKRKRTVAGSCHKGAAHGHHRAVQRLTFDSDSSNVSNSESKVKISPKRSETEEDSSGSCLAKSRLTPAAESSGVCLNAPGLQTPHPDTTYCSPSLTLDADQRGQADGEDATLGTSTSTSPGKVTKTPLECVVFPGSEESSLLEAATIQKSVDDVKHPEHECNNKGSVVEASGSSDSLETEKIGHTSRTQARRKRGVECRASAALGVVRKNSGTSSSSDVAKGVVVNSELQSCSTKVTAGSGHALTGTVSGASEPPSGEWATTRRTRQCKNNGAVLHVGGSQESHAAVVSCVLPAASPGPPDGAPGAGAGQAASPGADESGDAHLDPERTFRSDNCQDKHEQETSTAIAGAASPGPAARTLVIRKQTRAGEVPKAACVFAEQRVSLSVTLKVGPGAHGNGDLMVPGTRAGSADRWQAENLLRNCRMERRRKRKAGSCMADGPETATLQLGEDELLVPGSSNDSGAPASVNDEADGWFRKNDISKRVEETVEAEARRRSAEEEQVEESVPVAPPPGSSSSRLLRSLSCPDIPSLQDSDHTPLVLPHDRFLPLPHRRSCPAPPHTSPHRLYKRTRRHTVCTVEIEREIAPLCLRKEVHPVGWAGASGPVYPRYSPSVLASRFLSSPLAFLSNRSSRGWSDTCGSGDGGCGLAPSPPPAVPMPPSASPQQSLAAPPLTVFPAPNACGSSSPDWAPVSVSSPCSALESVTVEMEHGMEVDDQSTFGPELPSGTVSEEKDASHFEIKFQADGKKVQCSKVSSIRIRKTLPKPQYHLTPMGLPKAVRIKKKVFSVEEIYTNKNFSQPPEGRLETIFEVPLSRRDGSQSLIGQKRVKRFVEFPELGVARKPRKPLIGAAGVGGAQRKVVGNSGTGRTRRGVWASSRDEDALNLQDLESLLCSKLNELDSWMALEQMAY